MTVHVQRARDFRRTFLVRKKAGALQPELVCEYRGGQRVIRSCRTECRDPSRIAVAGTLKNVLEFADLVAAVSLTADVVTLDYDASKAVWRNDLCVLHRCWQLS